MQIIAALVITALCATASADVSHILQHESTPPPANPYIFSYQAGRAPGMVDRQHTEVSDGSGVIRGAYSYVDPLNQVRTVQYVADENGFHPELSHMQEDTDAVKLGKQKHFALYNRIAQEHASQQHQQVSGVVGPEQSEAVVRATNKHLSAFERIAAEHAAIAREREAERLAFEATSEHSDIENGQYQQQYQQQYQ